MDHWLADINSYKVKTKKIENSQAANDMLGIFEGFELSVSNGLWAE